MTDAPLELIPSANTAGADTQSSDLDALSSLDAEQQLLGSILLDNDAMDRVGEILTSEHFHEPLHGEIYTTIRRLVESENRVATPVILQAYFQDHPALRAPGRERYLAELAAAGQGSFMAPDLARAIRDFALRRELVKLGSAISARAKVSDLDSPPETQIEEAESELRRIAENPGAHEGFRSISESLREALAVADAAAQGGKGVSGVATGYGLLDWYLGGMQPTDLLIVAGRPAMGKTALALNIASYAARQFQIAAEAAAKEGAQVRPLQVGVFSLEMSGMQLATRLAARSSGVGSDRIRRGKLTDNELDSFRDAAQSLETLPIAIDETGALAIDRLCARARRLHREQGLGLVVVDYLQLVAASTSVRRSDSRVQEVSEVSRKLKALAKELRVPVLAAAQLSRATENREGKRPQLSDLRESGSIEQDADVVLMLYREAYYLESKKPDESDAQAFEEWNAKMAQVHDTAEVIIGKQRNGPTGVVRLRFDRERAAFHNVDDQSAEVPA